MAAKDKGKNDQRARAGRIAAALAELYPQARISLDFNNAWQCLVATILSAQCTDERVNKVTPLLFERIPDVAAMAAAPMEMVQELILTTGFFRQKAKSLKGAAHAIMSRFDGKVPAKMEDLVTLPGVGRKTANVLLGHVFGQPGLVVDTHVRRLALRLGLTKAKGSRPDRNRFAKAAAPRTMDAVFDASDSARTHRLLRPRPALRFVQIAPRLPADRRKRPAAFHHHGAFQEKVQTKNLSCDAWPNGVSVIARRPPIWSRRLLRKFLAVEKCWARP